MARAELATVPPLSFYESILWEAFNTLSTERQMSGMGGVGPIPWSSIIRYAQFYGLNMYETNDLIKAIAALDPIYIRDKADRASAAAKNRSSP